MKTKFNVPFKLLPGSKIEIAKKYLEGGDPFDKELVVVEIEEEVDGLVTGHATVDPYWKYSDPGYDE